MGHEPRRTQAVLAGLAVALLLAGCKSRRDRPENADSSSRGSDTLHSATVQLSITNVHLPVLPDVVLQIRTLTGTWPPPAPTRW
jgi:ABC-type uncharacterized transport system auxiliary subunit